VEQVASFDVRGKDVDTIFATDFTSDRCLSAIIAAQKQFDPSFPGWALYRRVLIGDGLLDRTLEAYAIGMARGVARAHKLNGRRVVPIATRKNAWLAQAGRDGLDFALFGKFPCGVNLRAEQFKVQNHTYQRVRDAVGLGIWIGLDTFAAECRLQFRKVYFAGN
jgi:hypothetical protein